MGVRISWDIRARKSLFARVAASASSLAARSATALSSWRWRWSRISYCRRRARSAGGTARARGGSAPGRATQG
ncbi:MAG: hypothetical protein AB1578_15260, partial [Thermodesulfobacteriota bacterium]